MPAVEVLGWAAACTGILLGLPQLLRLVRTRRVDGLSLTAWQAFLVVNLSWAAHGIAIGQPPQAITSTLSLCSTVPILVLLARELGRGLPSVLLPALAGAAAMIAIDRLFGSAVFGAMAIIPALVANGAQSVELVRAPRIVGVSGVFLLLAVVNQVVWLSWAILVADAGTIIITIGTGIITTFNLAWWTLRRAGLRPLFVPPPPRTSEHPSAATPSSS